MPTVSCPECGTNRDFALLAKLAEEFCERCDYPLFWAPSPLVGARSGAGDGVDEALRRLPGVGGHRQIVTRACPSCGEQNERRAERCCRCGELMDPPAPAPMPPLVVAPPPAPEPEPEPDRRSAALLWTVILTAILLISAVVIAFAV
ncbi:MAG: hypothetical protein OEY23_11425 [Acidimicrobiia bacterium]|nr:hypothetical protein [Acidimicrobiia bacterium]